RDPRGGGRPVPPSWVRPGVPSVQLAPHHATRISLELVVPAGAKPGTYVSNIVATASGELSAGGANLAPAAPTLPAFRLAPHPALWALLIVILLAAVVFAVRKSGLHVRVERESVGYGTADEHGGWHA